VGLFFGDQIDAKSQIQACWPRREMEALLNKLIKKGVDVNAVAWDRLTPLHLVIDWGTEGVVCQLLHAGANTNARTYSLETPLEVSIGVKISAFGVSKED
jgi:ankyrin repeat protein